MRLLEDKDKGGSFEEYQSWVIAKVRPKKVCLATIPHRRWLTIFR
jgi:hypothetical protein